MRRPVITLLGKNTFLSRRPLPLLAYIPPTYFFHLHYNISTCSRHTESLVERESILRRPLIPLFSRSVCPDYSHARPQER